MSNKGSVQPDGPPCTVKHILDLPILPKSRVFFTRPNILPSPGTGRHRDLREGSPGRVPVEAVWVRAQQIPDRVECRVPHPDLQV